MSDGNSTRLTLSGKRKGKRKGRAYSTRHIQDVRTGVPGFVYVAGVLEGCHKIGSSVDPDLRLAQMLLLPVELVTVAEIKSADARWLEMILHRHFATKRVRGEWFRLTYDDIGVLKSRSVINGPGDLPEAFTAAGSPLTAPVLAATDAVVEPENLFTPEEFVLVRRAIRLQPRDLRLWIKNAFHDARVQWAGRIEPLPVDGFVALAKQLISTDAELVIQRHGWREQMLPEVVPLPFGRGGAGAILSRDRRDIKRGSQELGKQSARAKSPEPQAT
jgi:hypothetical protein